jgi:hyaluronoglucosaminidase
MRIYIDIARRVSDEVVMTTPELGIIEGYFGRTWTWAERAGVIDRLAPAGYRFFHYAPKIDSRLRRDWQQLHSAEDAQSIAAFSAHCRANVVRFGVGLTPYGAHLDFNSEVRAALKAKLTQLDRFGLDDLAILFDDMRGDLPDLAERQAEIVAFILDHSTASRFFMCPSYYANDPVLDRVFGARPQNYLKTLGRLIDPGVAVYWTGEEVCSAEISVGHLADVAVQLGRRVALWDNYPVNDGPRMSQHLHLRGFTGRPHGIANHITHHAINPALQPVLGCIPALTLPMRYEQGDAYCYGAAMAQAATRVVGPQLAHMLESDLLSFQNNGLDRLGDRVPKLRAKYAALDHPAAREVVDWLDGGYAITGEMLETQ